MPYYDNETCESCRYYREKMTETARHETCLDAEMSRESGWPDLRDQCDRFDPSLQCRRVVALETLANRSSAEDM